MGRRRFFVSFLFLTAAMAASAAPVSAGGQPGPLAIRMQCTGPGPNGTVAPGQTDNCGVYISSGTLTAGSIVQITISSPAIRQLTCMQGTQGGNNSCTFTVATTLVSHGSIGGEEIQFAGPGTISASVTCGRCGQFMFTVFGPGSTVYGTPPRINPNPPYVSEVCSGPNPDGTVSETQTDTCQIFTAGFGGPFIPNDRVTVTLTSPADAYVTSCPPSGGGGDGSVAAGNPAPQKSCSVVFSGTVAGAGQLIGTEGIYIPNTVVPGTPIEETVTFCPTPSSGMPAACGGPIPISVSGPGATVIDEIPPTFTFVPADMTVDATGPTDTVVIYPSPTAADNAPGPVAIACTPGSGAMFSVGTTVVVCTATDASGNVATATFNVTAQNTPESLCRVTQLDVTKEGVAHSLCEKLQHEDFGAYINEVEAQSGKSMTDQQATDLEGLAQLLMA